MTKEELTKTVDALKNENDVLKAKNAELEEKLVNLANSQNQKEPEPVDDENKNKIGLLFSAVCRSCADHCPHHMDEEACKHCTIHKLVDMAGFQITKPEEKEIL